MLDLFIGLAFGALLLRLADRLQNPRPVAVPLSQRDSQGSRR
jgi:hypothetical protein